MHVLKNYDFSNWSNPYETFKRKELGRRLAGAQRLIERENIPVLIIIDGWESSGKGYIINDLIRELNPRSYKVSVFENPNDEEKSRPFLWRFWEKIPSKGNFALFDRSFYFKVMNDLNISSEELERDIADIASIEKELADDGTLVLKFFLHQKKQTQQKRIEELQKDQNRAFMVSERDEEQSKHYAKYLDHFDQILERSNVGFSQWHIISTEDKKSASKKIMGMTLDLLYEGIDQRNGLKSGGMRYLRTFETSKKPLDNLDGTLALTKKEYGIKKDKLQKEAQELTYQLYLKKIPAVIVFEGVDAAGKGGAIKRLTRMMDPRGYEVVPISAPNETENQYHYLWRFYQKLPAKGNLAIFDRSWYGRVMVERVEGFATVDEWDRAYEEINQMEKHLSHFGALILKFFIYIDKDEQLSRFESREAEPGKVYKLTEEDWRNRKKWDEYIEAMNEMLVRTDTDHAPWTIVEGNDKRYARIKVLQEFVVQAKKSLNEQK